jgi:hypothetical protein
VGDITLPVIKMIDIDDENPFYFEHGLVGERAGQTKLSAAIKQQAGQSSA